MTFFNFNLLLSINQYLKNRKGWEHNWNNFIKVKLNFQHITCLVTNAEFLLILEFEIDGKCRESWIYVVTWCPSSYMQLANGSCRQHYPCLWQIIHALYTIICGKIFEPKASTDLSLPRTIMLYTQRYTKVTNCKP